MIEILDNEEFLRLFDWNRDSHLVKLSEAADIDRLT